MSIYCKMLDLAVEFIGTFVFLTIVLTTGQPIPIVVGLLAAIYFGGHISGGHFNPAISTMFLAKGTLSVDKYIGYVLAQVLGGLVALMFYRLNASVKSK